MSTIDTWKPADFSEEELAGIDPVIRQYMQDVDQTLLIESLKLTVEQRIAHAEACLADAAALQAATRGKAK